ncbi:MAG: hypothetical protein HY695_29410 [Deltaproteobacteria bacterium]|nr:hypothetical protein [Deltaproteobacteria bacterium]
MLASAVIGVALILAGEALSFFHVLPWSRYVFPLFWYGYLLVVDSINHRLHGQSLISSRFEEFAFMLPISAFYWYLFEWYNLVVQNWTYINTPSEKWIEVTMKLVSFATVIPAIFETEHLLSWFVKTRRRKIRLYSSYKPNRSLLPIGATGLLLSVLPPLLPKLFFWAVWIGPLVLFDTINYYLGRHSFLRDWRSRDLSRTALFLLAGYVCGFFWEFWNYWAYTKWVYTVPIPNMPHIFEMPVLGFLGFGPFGLETCAFWTLVWGREKR